MTSSYGYPRSLTNEEKLYLENQALQAELQRRDERKQGLKEAITGGLATGLGLGALGTGAVALGSMLSPAQKAKIGRNLSSTVDLAKEGIDKARRSVASRVAPPEAPAPSRPAPTSAADRLRQAEEVTRIARTERPQGNVVLDLGALQGQEQAIASARRAFETEAADQFLARGVEPRATTGGLARPAVQPQDFLDEAVEEVSVKVLDQPGQTFGGAAAPAGLLEPISRSRKEAVYSAVAAKPESELPRVYKPSGGADVELITDPNTGEIFRRGKSPESFSELYLQRQGYTDAGTLVDQQSLTAFDNADQTVAALQSGEDQATGRTMRAIQRNEDENIGAVNAAKDLVENQLAKVAIENPSVASTLEVDAAANRVASGLADGLPVDQAEGFGNIWALEEQLERQGKKAQAWLASEQRRAPVLDVEKQMYDLVGRAAEQGFDLEPSRALSLLTNPTVEMSAQEQRLFRMDPAMGKIALRGQTFEPGQQQTGASFGILGDKLSSVPNVGQDPSSPIVSAASGTSIRGTSRVPNVPDQFTVRRSSSNQPVEADVFTYDEGGTVTWSPGKQLTEIEFESQKPQYTRYVSTPLTREQRPAYFGPGFAPSEELKQGLAPESAPEGMRAVRTSEKKTYFTPIGDPGGIGVYGEERRFAGGPIVKYSDPLRGTVQGEYTITAQRAPTEMPFPERPQGGVGFSEMSTEQLKGFINKAPEGSIRLAGQKELAKREATKQSLAASELYRRGRIEGLF